MPRMRSVDQLAIDEQKVADDRLLTALESWHNARTEASAAGKVSREAKAAAKALLTELEIPFDVPIRVGQFRLTRFIVAGGERTFTASDREDVKYSLDD
jgi:hypothetical protein